MAENRNFTYTVNLDATKAIDTVEQYLAKLEKVRKEYEELAKSGKLKVETDGTSKFKELDEQIKACNKAVEELRKNMQSIRSGETAKVVSDREAKKIEEIGKQLNEVRSVVDELKKGNLTITNDSANSKLGQTNKNVKDIKDSTDAATKAMQTYAEKLRVVQRLIDNVDQKIKETGNVNATGALNGVDLTMKELRKMEDSLKQDVKRLKNESVEGIQSIVAKQEADAVKQQIAKIDRDMARWRQRLKDSMKGLEPELPRSTFNDFRRYWEQYNKFRDEHGYKVIENPFTRFTPLGKNGDWQEYHKQVSGYYDDLAKAAKKAKEVEQETQKLISEINKLNKQVDLKDFVGKRLSPDQYLNNYNEIQKKIARLQELGTDTTKLKNNYSQSPTEYKRDQDRIVAQQKINKLVSEYNNLLVRANSLIERHAKLTNADYGKLQQSIQERRDKIRSLEAANNISPVQLTENPIVDDAQYNTHQAYTNSILQAVAAEKQLVENAKSEQVRTFSKEISNLTASCEALYRAYQANPTDENLMAFAKTRKALENTCAEYRLYQKEIERTGTRLSEFGRKAFSHMAWITTGAGIAATTALPVAYANTLQNIESKMAAIRQVIPEIEANPMDAGTEKFATQQDRMNKSMEDFIGISKQYGVSIDETMEAARSIGRMYGQGEGGADRTAMVTNAVAKMSVADAFPMEAARRGLESALSQWNFKVDNTDDLMRNSQYIIDVWTKTAHNGAASAQDIAEGIEAAGTAAAQAGVSFNFFNALLETGVRTTARSGNEIGQSIKSMMVTMNSDKATEALKEWGIAVDEVDEKGQRHRRNMEDIIMDVSLAVSTTDKDTTKLLTTLAGGRYQYSKVSAMLKNYKELLRMRGILNDGDVHGFTDKQVQVQISTLERKMQRLKTDAENIFVDIGQNGGLETLKWIANKLDDILVGFRKINETGGSAFHSTSLEATKLITEIALVYKVGQKLLGMYISGKAAAKTAWQTSDGQLHLGDRYEKWKNARIERGAEGGYRSGKDTSVTAGETAAVQGNSTVTQENTAITNANTMAQQRNSVARGVDAQQVARQDAEIIAHNNKLTTENAVLTGNTSKTDANGKAQKKTGEEVKKAGQKMQATTKISRLLSAAEATLTTVTRGLSAAFAALGGWPGVIATVLLTLGTDLLVESEAAGEAAKETESLAQKQEELYNEVQGKVDTINDQEQALESLGNQYNKLAEQIDSGTLSTEEQQRAEEELGEIDKTVAQILGQNTEQFKENGRMKIDSLKGVCEQDKATAIQTLKDDQAELDSQVQQAQADVELTDAAVQDAQERINALDAEVDACQNTATAWQKLKNVILEIKMAIADAKINMGNDLLDTLDKFTEGKLGAIQSWLFQNITFNDHSAEITRDDNGNLVLSTDAAGNVRSYAQELIDEGEADKQRYIDEIKNSGDIQEIKAFYDTIHGSLQSDYEKAQQRNGEAQEKLASLKNEAKQNALRIYNLEHSQTGNEQSKLPPEEDKDKKKGGGSTPSGRSKSDDSSTESKHEKDKFGYWDDTQRATYNLSKEVENFGLDVPTLLSLVGQINGINNLDFSKLTDPYMTGGKDPFDSAWKLIAPFMKQMDAGKNIADAMKALYGKVPGFNWDKIEGATNYLNNGNKKDKFYGYDFNARAPKKGFADPDNQTVSTGYAGTKYSGAGEVQKEIIEAAERHKINPKLLMQVARTESELNQNAVSPAGAIGVMQLMPGTASALGVNPYDRKQNIEGGAKYLKEMLDTFDGDVTKAVAAYNAGPQAVRNYGGVPPYKETQEYVQKVLNYDVSSDLAQTVTAAIGNIGDAIVADADRHPGDKWSGSAAGFDNNADLANQCASWVSYELSQRGIHSIKSTGVDGITSQAGDAYQAGRKPVNAGDIIRWGNHVGFYDGHGGYVARNSGGGIHHGKLSEITPAYGFGDFLGSADIKKIAEYNGVVYQSGTTAQDAGRNIAHAWRVQKDELQGFHQYAYEIKQAMDKVSSAMHEAAKATLDFQNKIRGSLNIDQYKDTHTDAENQLRDAKVNFEFWQKEHKIVNDALWAELHNGKNDEVLKTIGYTDYGKLSDSAQERLSKHGTKELQDLTKGYHETRDSLEKARNEKLASWTNYFESGGYMNHDELIDAKLQAIDDQYEVIKNHRAMYSEEADLEAAQKKYDILKEYRVELEKILNDAIEQSKVDEAATQLLIKQKETAVSAAQAKRDASKKKLDDLMGENDNSDRHKVALQAADDQFKIDNDSLKREQTELTGLKQELENTHELGNKATRDAVSKLNKVDGEMAKLQKTLNKTMVEFESTVTNSMDTMFSNILMEGKSFSDSFKDLWKDIGRFALQTLERVYLNKMIAGWFGGAATGGAVDGVPGKATGGVIPGFATGGQPGGAIRGAGDGTSDSILAYMANKDRFVYLSNGEYVMTAEATKRIGVNNLDNMNYGKYATGGALDPVPYVPHISAKVTGNMSSISRKNPNERMEDLMREQIQTTKGLRDSEGKGGGLVVLNTQASSADVLKALAENPRAVQAILGRQQRYGFR